MRNSVDDTGVAKFPVPFLRLRDVKGLTQGHTQQVVRIKTGCPDPQPNCSIAPTDEKRVNKWIRMVWDWQPKHTESRDQELTWGRNRG